MGMFKGRWSSSGDNPKPNQNDPDPNNYKILKEVQFGKYWVYLIHYPNCTNYEGKKCVLTNSQIDNKKSFDPHFMEGNSVIARFRPTEKGFKNAVIMADILNGQR